MSPQIAQITLFFKILWLNTLAVSSAFTQSPYQAQTIHKIHNSWGGQSWWLMDSGLPTSGLPPSGQSWGGQSWHSPLGRLAKVGESNRAAAKRRAWAKREGERLEEERRAHWRAHVQGRGVMRGEFVYTIWFVLFFCYVLFCFGIELLLEVFHYFTVASSRLLGSLFGVILDYLSLKLCFHF